MKGSTSRAPALLLLVLPAMLVSSELWANETDQQRCKVTASRTALLSLLRAESSFLSRLSAEAFIGNDFEVLAPGVFKVRDRTRTEFVVRFPSVISDTQFERFSNRFLRSVPGIRAPEVRLLSPEDSARFLKSVSERKPHAYSRMRRGFQAAGLDPSAGKLQASYTLFYDAPNGLRATWELGINAQLRQAIQRIAHDELPIPDALKRIYVEELKEGWDKANEAQRMAVFEDVRALFPAARSIGLEDLVPFLSNQLEAIQGSPLKGILIEGAKRLPPQILTDLSDQWAIYTVLGIRDFHPGNWLLMGDRTMAIDSALNSVDFKNGLSSLRLNSHMQPFDKTDPTTEVYNFLLSRLSSGAVKFLENLTADRVRQIAAQSSFPLTDDQLQGILARARLVVQEHSALTRVR